MGRPAYKEKPNIEHLKTLPSPEEIQAIIEVCKKVSNEIQPSNALNAFLKQDAEWKLAKYQKLLEDMESKNDI